MTDESLESSSVYVILRQGMDVSNLAQVDWVTDSAHSQQFFLPDYMSQWRQNLHVTVASIDGGVGFVSACHLKQGSKGSCHPG